IKMRWHSLLITFFTTCCFLSVNSYKILCLFPHVAKSHFIMAEALMKGLALRGHEVTMVSHFPQKTPLKNYKDINLIGSMPEYVNSVPIDAVSTGYPQTTIDLLAHLGYTNCENTLKHPAVTELIASDEKFDLVVTELFNTDCFLGFVYKLNAPFISLSTSILMPWAHARFGNPDIPSYMGNHFSYLGTRMTFTERLKNILYEEFHKLWYHYMFDKPAYDIAKKYFGENLPPLHEIAKNTSLLLVNSHFSLNRPRPLVPNIIEVGGLHLEPSKGNLPEDIKKFLDGAKDGAVIFSLGSSIRMETLSEEKRNAFFHAFAELPQRVLVKWEGDTLPGKPDNVMLVPWMPQMDVLAHPNTKVFVTHGGLMGTMESSFNGVPMVAIPIFGDQYHNVRCYEENGIAIRLNYHTISKQTVLSAIKTVLITPVMPRML
ncbi:hypothetical protein L9F63_008363, partial [Diploptera punctata]